VLIPRKEAQEASSRTVNLHQEWTKRYNQNLGRGYTGVTGQVDGQVVHMPQITTAEENDEVGEERSVEGDHQASL